MTMPREAEHAPVLEVRGLTRRFGSETALDNVSLSVPRGTVFSLIGANGAGKTTLIKHVLGLFRAQAGSVRVFGGDPVTDPVGILGRIGYLSEDNDLPPWMTVAELIRYTQAFYPTWDASHAEQLRQAFGLDPSARVKNLSKGQAARAGLLVALAHRPELLVLDEPSSGLDPIVRRDILGAIIRTIADQGNTVLFSSHLLDEVERVSDHVALIDQGRIVLCAPLDHVKGSHHCLTLRFPEAVRRPPALPGALAWSGADREWTALCNGGLVELESSASACGAHVVERRVPSLEEIFVARVGTPTSGGN